MAIKLNKDKPTYGKSYGGYLVYKVDNVTNKVLCISTMRGEINSVTFDYDTPANTYNNNDATYITKAEFDKKLKEAKNKLWQFKP